MKATAENPIYTVYIVNGTTKYNVTPALDKIDRSDPEKQMAQYVTLSLANVKVGSKLLSNILQMRDRVYVYANDGSKNDEVFRGYLWTRGAGEALEDEIFKLKCYDNLIYFQESEEYEYFTSGKSTKSVLQSLADKWGVKLEYSYESITHEKLVLRGSLSDIWTADILDIVKDKTGKKYVVRSEKDVVHVKTEGSNTTIYTIKSGKNLVSVSSEETMDGMVTKVVILGKADDDDRSSIEETVKGDTAKYGTLQTIINRDDSTSKADAKKEADAIIKEKGKTKWSYDITAPDIPWIRKGDKFKVEAGTINKYLIAVGIERDISNKKKTMTITAVDV